MAPTQLSKAEKAELTESENILTAPTITKYQTAAEITKNSLLEIITQVVAGAIPKEVCIAANTAILAKCAKVYQKTPTGIAFPCCISVNNVLCHDDQNETPLAAGDIVRVELGAHIDGFMSQLAHTLIIGATSETPAVGSKANVVMAAYTAMQASVRKMVDGENSDEITRIVDVIAKEFDCVAVKGMISHQILKNVIDGPNRIILAPTEAQKKQVESFNFKTGECYSLDICISSGVGATKDSSDRTTIYKRNPNSTYQLKMKTSRAVFSQVQKQFGMFPFSISQVQDMDLRKSRMGIVEVQAHNLVDVYPHLLIEEDVARFVCTVLILPNGPIIVAEIPMCAIDGAIVSEKKVCDAEVIELLARPLRPKKSKKPAQVPVPMA